MNKPYLKINIVGYVNCGKTTVAKLIKDALESHGIKANVHDLEPISVFHDQKACLESLKEKGLHVEVEVFQAIKDGYRTKKLTVQKNDDSLD